MGSLNNSVETVTAAATAIVSAESRVQPSSTPRKRWRSCWRLYCCFGSQKSNKKIIHAVVPESTVPGVPASTGEPISLTAIVMPFIAPPSSPAFQSDPPSATQSPAGLLSVASLSVNAYSSNGPASIFTVGPYAYETQLVSPPVFSTFTTEPSTACFTPPPETLQLTTPSSPDVPFAQLLTSSLERSRRNIGINHKFSLSHYEYQQYPGSPGAQLISPGSAISTSGTSTPFYDRCIVEVRMGEAPKILGFEHFTTRKWGSRLGSGSLTPDGTGLGSRLGSGCLTPDGVGTVSRQSSGWVTPDAVGQDSRFGSGCLTPVNVGPKTQEIRFFENQTYEATTSLANYEDLRQSSATNNHRISFELTGEDIARCLANKSVASTANVLGLSQDMLAESKTEREGLPEDRNNPTESCSCEICVEISGKDSVERENQCGRQHLSVSLGSIKEFNFDNSKTDASNNPSHGPKWWANNKMVGEEAKPVDIILEANRFKCRYIMPQVKWSLINV